MILVTIASFWNPGTSHPNDMRNAFRARNLGLQIHQNVVLKISPLTMEARLKQKQTTPSWNNPFLKFPKNDPLQYLVWLSWELRMNKNSHIFCFHTNKNKINWALLPSFPWKSSSGQTLWVWWRWKLLSFVLVLSLTGTGHPKLYLYW